MPFKKSKDTLFFKDGEQYYPRRISAYSNKDDSYLVERFINPDKYKEYTLEEYVMGKAKGCRIYVRIAYSNNLMDEVYGALDDSIRTTVIYPNNGKKVSEFIKENMEEIKRMKLI